MPPPAHRSPAAPYRGVNKVVILLVEDDESVRSSTAELLRELGHDVVEAADSESALGVIRARPVDVLFADVRLPGKPGDVFAAEARAEQAAIRIVFATGVQDMPDTGAEGGPVLLRKPYSAADIQAALTAASA